MVIISWLTWGLVSAGKQEGRAIELETVKSTNKVAIIVFVYFFGRLFFQPFNLKSCQKKNEQKNILRMDWLMENKQTNCLLQTRLAFFTCNIKKTGLQNFKRKTDFPLSYFCFFIQLMPDVFLSYLVWIVFLSKTVLFFKDHVQTSLTIWIPLLCDLIDFIKALSNGFTFFC